jgi:muramoyltetrapeptide carboxypeptidase
MLAMPPPLRAGDTLAIVAPSSPFPRDELLRGLAWLRARYRLRMSSGCFAREGYLAGNDARRRDELVRALRDPDVKAIVAARGGYGATRIVHDVPWDELARAPKWVVGFSDVTALHAMAWRAGVASVHGPNVTGLGRDASARTRAAWLYAVERPQMPVTWNGLRVVVEGEATGPIVGGNLAVLEAIAAARLLALPQGAVLAIEDVTERPYRVDRMLTALRTGRWLERIAAIVIGEFDQCAPGADGRTVESVLEERTCDLGIPVVARAPFGHGALNDAFVLGARAHVRGDTVAIG